MSFLVDSFDEIIGRNLGKPLELEDLLLFQGVDICHVTDQTSIEQGGNVFLSHTFDIHSTFGSEMLDMIVDTCRTFLVGTSGYNLFVGFFKFRATFRTMCRHAECSLTTIAEFDDRLDDLRDDVTRFVHHNCIANHDTLTLDLVLVVKRCHLYGTSCHYDRLQYRHGRSRTCTAYGYENIFDLGRRLLCRIFVRHSTTRVFADHTKSFVERSIIDLDDQTISIKR